MTSGPGDVRGRPGGVPPDVAREARELRRSRRTNSGWRLRPWQEIADELRRRGSGRFKAEDLADAVAGLPIDEHELAPTPPEQLEQLERSFREGWATDFPGELWPGLAEARRRLRERATRW